MRGENCILPIQCKQCGTIFDLWYDLNYEESLPEQLLEDTRTIRSLRESLCWKCRQLVARKLQKSLETKPQSEDTEFKLVFE